MGLDMFLYKITKPSARVLREIEGMDAERIRRDYDLNLMPADDVEENLAEIKNWLGKTKATFYELDIASIKKDHGIPETAETSGRCYNVDIGDGKKGNIFTFAGTKTMKIPVEKFTAEIGGISRVGDRPLVWKTEEVMNAYEKTTGTRYPMESFLDAEGNVTNDNISDVLLRWNTDETWEVRLTAEEIKEKYLVPHCLDAYAYSSKEIAYWRKNYELQDEIYEASDNTVDNVKYVPMNEEMWKAVQRHKKIAKKENTTRSVYCYFEWY